MAEKTSLIILAGGRSKRMGRDKLWLDLDGQPLIERVLKRALPLGNEVIICANDPDRHEALLRSLPVPGWIATDLFVESGPLAGIHAGLRMARYDLTVVIAADMPFVNTMLFQHMLAQAGDCDAVVPYVYDNRTQAEAPEPLHAVYRRSCLPAIAGHLAAGERQAFCFFPDVRVKSIPPEEVERFDPNQLSFFNVNTPQDWQLAQQLAADRQTIH